MLFINLNFLFEQMVLSFMQNHAYFTAFLFVCIIFASTHTHPYVVGPRSVAVLETFESVPPSPSPAQ